MAHDGPGQGAFPADRSRRRRPAERIEVGALDDATIEELLASALGGPVDAATVRELADHSRGNPMFLRELVSGALETRALVDAGGLWCLAGALSPTVRLAELVALRLGDLNQPSWPSWPIRTRSIPSKKKVLSLAARRASG